MYIDTGHNAHGRLLAAPFGVRPLPGALVSMPLRWHEVNSRLRVERYAIRNAAKRMRALSADRLIEVLTEKSNLEAVLDALSRYLC